MIVSNTGYLYVQHDEHVPHEIRRGRRPRVAVHVRGLLPKEEPVVADRQPEDEEVEVRPLRPQRVPLRRRRDGLPQRRILGIAPQERREVRKEKINSEAKI